MTFQGNKHNKTEEKFEYKNAMLNISKEELHNRKGRLISQLNSFLFLLRSDPEHFVNINNLFQLVLKAPEECYLDKVFSLTNSGDSILIEKKEIPNFIKKLHMLINSIPLNEKEQMKYLHNIRYLMKLYFKR